MINETNIQNKITEYTTFENAIIQVETELNKVLLSAPQVIRLYTEHLTLSRGKSIRAVSCLACAENKDMLIHTDAVKIATAIELLHLATLVHDDVIDNAKTRRGIITLQKKYGKRTAVICGDYLLCLSLKIAASVSRRKNYIELDFPEYISRICIGELQQNVNNRNLNLSFYNYIKIISGKTAALFDASFKAGAKLCDDVKDDEIRLFSQLGLYIGIIFQLTDDCIDYESTKKIAKKPVLSDYKQGVITLPLIYTFEKNKEIKNKANLNMASIKEISSAVTETGGVAFTHLISKKYYDKAILIINKTNSGIAKRERLISILNKAYNSDVLPHS
ncbi:MAG: polyprenyl synthetase family protein [Eubacteriales bacterium]